MALSDQFHGPANVTQALRLWHQSGQPEQAFVEQYLYEAQNRTRRAQGAQGLGFIANKMAYFFQTLRDLVEHTNGR